MRHKKWELIKEIISENWASATKQEIANAMNDSGIRKQNGKKIDKSFIAYAMKQMDKEQAKSEPVKFTPPPESLPLVAEDPVLDDEEASEQLRLMLVQLVMTSGHSSNVKLGMLYLVI